MSELMGIDLGAWGAGLVVLLLAGGLVGFRRSWRSAGLLIIIVVLTVAILMGLLTLIVTLL